MELQPVTQRFVLHWGEMGARWGVNRTVAQIHALLYITGRPMDAEEITQTLGVARSNVSTSLKELLSWRLVRVVHQFGERRDLFETSTDVWELFRIIVEGRKQREIEPTLGVLRECLSSPDMSREDVGAQARIRETLEFMETLTRWSDEMLRLPPETLAKVLKLGARVSKLLRSDNDRTEVEG